MSVRVVVVDDSAIARARLEGILEAASIRVVRSLPGLVGLDLGRALSVADVVLVDMLMPGRSGLAALTELVSQKPVVVVSDAAADSELASEALARGARAWVSKRELGEEAGCRRLVRLVRDAAQVCADAGAPIVVMVGSTGAHRAAARLVPALERACGVFLLHLPEGGDVHIPAWLGGLGRATAFAEAGTPLEPGRVLIARPGRHVELEPPGRVRLRAPGPGDLHVPSADRLLRSCASLGGRVTAVVLSGLGRDGAAGVGPIVAAGGTVLVQNPIACVAPSMPRAALETEGVRALSLERMFRELARAR